MRAAHALLFSFFPRSSPAIGLVTFVALAACVREGPPVVAPVDISIESADAGAGAASPLVISAPPPIARDRQQRCTALLHASPIKTNPGCSLDERISRGNGTLFYPCSGDGPVEAVFGEHTFEGKVTDKSLVLALTTEPDWNDGCHWEAKQGLRGDWNRETAKPAKLAWTYREQPVSGTGCLGACRATADIEIHDVSPP
jgi:hypothetical protein